MVSATLLHLRDKLFLGENVLIEGNCCVAHKPFCQAAIPRSRRAAKEPQHAAHLGKVWIARDRLLQEAFCRFISGPGPGIEAGHGAELEVVDGEIRSRLAHARSVSARRMLGSRTPATAAVI